MYSPIRIFVVDIDQILIENHLLDFFVKTFPEKNEKLNRNATLKRFAMRIFEIFEFFAMKIWLKYRVNEKLISFLNYQREEKDAKIFIVTDRSRLGVNNIIEYLKPLRKNFIQIRSGFLKRNESEIFEGKNLKTSIVTICECPWIKPDIRVINKLASPSESLIIDNSEMLREKAKEAGFSVFPGIQEYINDEETFVNLLKKRTG